VHDPVDGPRSARPANASRQQPDAQIGAGPAKPDRVEAPLGQALGRRQQGSPCAPPRPPRGRARYSRQTWAICSHRRSSPASGSSSDGPGRPGGGRAGRGGPVRRLLVDHLGHLLDGGQLVAAGAHGSEVVEHAGRGGAGQTDARAAQLAELEHPAAVPGRHVLEGVLGRMQDPLALDVHVEVGDVHELRACALGRAGDRPGQLPPSPARPPPRRPARAGRWRRSRRSARRSARPAPGRGCGPSWSRS